MKRFALLSFVALGAAALAQACSGPDLSIAQNGDAGKSNQQEAGAGNQTGGSVSVGGTATSSAGKTALGGTSSTSGGSRALGGTGGLDVQAGAGGESVADLGGATGAGGDSTTGCTGTTPLCFGNNTANCCGNDPAGQAVCQGGKWMCFGTAPAPGCSGDRCTDLFACGPNLKCNLTKAYCTVLAGGIGGDQYQCTPLPKACGPSPTCDCIDRPECQSCKQDFVGQGIVESCAVG